MIKVTMIAPLIKKEILVLSVTVLVSISLVLGGYFYLDEAEMEKNNSIKILKQEKNKYRMAENKKKILYSTKDEYRHVVKSGLLDKEDRVNWLKNIDLIIGKYKIPKVKYTIAKQIKLNDSALMVGFPKINVLESAMSIDMAMLHEVDLLKFIKDLDKKAHGIFDIKSCQLKRLYINFEDIIEHKKYKNISVHCDFVWVSLQMEGV